MTPEKHAAVLSLRSLKRMYDRQIAGQQAHGGRLWRKETLRTHLRDELIDALAYAEVACEQAEEVVDLLHRAKKAQSRDASRGWIQSAINILTVGNAEGIEEEELEDGQA